MTLLSYQQLCVEMIPYNQIDFWCEIVCSDRMKRPLDYAVTDAGIL